jgi:hypothetical protein
MAVTPKWIVGFTLAAVALAACAHRPTYEVRGKWSADPAQTCTDGGFLLITDKNFSVGNVAQLDARPVVYDVVRLHSLENMKAVVVLHITNTPQTMQLRLNADLTDGQLRFTSVEASKDLEPATNLRWGLLRLLQSGEPWHPCPTGAY